MGSFVMLSLVTERFDSLVGVMVREVLLGMLVTWYLREKGFFYVIWSTVSEAY